MAGINHSPLLNNTKLAELYCDPGASPTQKKKKKNFSSGQCYPFTDRVLLVSLIFTDSLYILRIHIKLHTSLNTLHCTTHIHIWKSHVWSVDVNSLLNLDQLLPPRLSPLAHVLGSKVTLLWQHFYLPLFFGWSYVGLPQRFPRAVCPLWCGNIRFFIELISITCEVTTLCCRRVDVCCLS